MYLSVEKGFEYSPGEAINVDVYQFKELQAELRRRELDTGRREPPRGFSLSSSPFDECISLTIKVEEPCGGVPPLLTPYLLTRVNKGDVIQFAGPYGTYKLPVSYKDKSCIVYINAGSGIAPSHGIWNFIIKDSPQIRQFLLFQNKTRNDIIYRDELFKLHWQGLLDVSIYLSRDDFSDAICKRGYIDLEAIIERLGDADLSPLFFVCGPNKPGTRRKGFRDCYVDRLKGAGVPASDIITETW